MHRIAPIIILGVLIFVFSAPAGAEPIFLYHHTAGGGTCCIPVSTKVRILFGQYDTALPGLTTTIFGSYLFGVDDIGSTFTANAATDPNFETLSATLTDGVDDYVGIGVYTPDGYGGTGASPESFFFRELPPIYGRDLLGYRLTQISLTINDLTLAPLPPPLGGLQMNVSTTFTFEGERDMPVVPEPTTIALVSGGLALIAARRRSLRRPNGASVSAE